MRDIVKSIPWSGVGFIFASVILVSFWTDHKYIPFPYVILTEIGLFFFFFYICDKESERK